MDGGEGSGDKSCVYLYIQSVGDKLACKHICLTHQAVRPLQVHSFGRPVPRHLPVFPSRQ